MNTQLKALLESYARSVFAAATALYLVGVTDPLDLAWSLVAAIAPVVIRYVNPNDKAFGRVPKAEEVEAALTKAKAKKAPSEVRAAVKRVTSKAPAKKTGPKNR